MLGEELLLGPGRLLSTTGICPVAILDRSGVLNVRSSKVRQRERNDYNVVQHRPPMEANTLRYRLNNGASTTSGALHRTWSVASDER